MQTFTEFSICIEKIAGCDGVDPVFVEKIRADFSPEVFVRPPVIKTIDEYTFILMAISTEQPFTCTEIARILAVDWNDHEYVVNPLHSLNARILWEGSDDKMKLT